MMAMGEISQMFPGKSSARNKHHHLHPFPSRGTRRKISEKKITYRFLGRNATPHVRTRVIPHRLADTTGLVLILTTDGLNLALDIGKGVEGGICDLVLKAVLLKTEATTGKEHVGFTSGGQIGDTVADEDDQGHLVRETFELGTGARLVDGEGLVVAEFIIVAPDGFPGGAIDDGVVGDDVD